MASTIHLLLQDLKEYYPPTSSGKLSCCDDDGLAIDGYVSLLKKYKPEEYDLGIVHHVYGMSLRKIAKKRKCSDGTIRNDMQTAEGFIGGCIAMLGLEIFNG